MRALSFALVAVVALVSTACVQEQNYSSLVGRDGILRFNLVFTNESNVDLDLHVINPEGGEIAWDTPQDDTGGELDVDCFCVECDSGPNENIFWDYGGDAPRGTYGVSVVYFGECADDTESSDYTLRVLESGVVQATYTGTLDSPNDEDSYTHEMGPS